MSRGGSGALVVGLGNPDRGDDAVGAVVVRAVAALGLTGLDVRVSEDPIDLVELWTGRDAVVVVDAVRSGAEPGTLRVLRAGQGAPRLPEAATVKARHASRGGSHALGLAEAVELARALGRLPRRLALVGIEAAGCEHGAPLSEPVAAAVPRAVETIVALVDDARAAPALAEASGRENHDVSR